MHEMRSSVARGDHGCARLVDRRRCYHRLILHHAPPPTETKPSPPASSAPTNVVEDVPVGVIAVGDQLLVRAGEIVPVDGVVTSDVATIDESALTGEPMRVVKTRGTGTFSGTLNAGETSKVNAEVATYASELASLTMPSPRRRTACQCTCVRAGRVTAARAFEILGAFKEADMWSTMRCALLPRRASCSAICCRSCMRPVLGLQPTHPFSATPSIIPFAPPVTRRQAHRFWTTRQK